ncbi:hypothetical protein LCGC14_1746940 [marine sediment metagenome]|uniref:Uncharacterized protein n=1 Tax=marine sediment metagenome TaxID=412755 RepID=A0A0F9H511_9ZZZZ
MDESQVDKLVTEPPHKPQKFYRLCGAPIGVDDTLVTCTSKAAWKLWPSGWQEEAIYRCHGHLANAIDASVIDGSSWSRMVLERWKEA